MVPALPFPSAFFQWITPQGAHGKCSGNGWELHAWLSWSLNHSHASKSIQHKTVFFFFFFSSNYPSVSGESLQFQKSALSGAPLCHHLPGYRQTGKPRVCFGRGDRELNNIFLFPSCVCKDPFLFLRCLVWKLKLNLPLCFSMSFCCWCDCESGSFTLICCSW